MPRAVLRLKPGEQVGIRVRGVSGTARGAWSDLLAVMARIDSAPPDPPTNLVITGGHRTLYCRWRNNPDDKDIKFCFLYLDTSAISLDSFGRVDISALSPNARVHAVDADCLYVADLNPDTTYYARVEAVDMAGNRSQASGQASGTTEAPEAPIANAKNDYTTGDLDTEAEIIDAVNGLASKINAILDVLRAQGLIEES